MRLIFFVFIFAMFGCQNKPTKVFETSEFKNIVRPQLDRPIKIGKKTIVFDARDPFIYTMAHLQGSVNLQWTDFSQKRPLKGLLVDDLYFHSRRLARMGVTPNSEVVIIGNGLNGSGEEYRLAWTLYYMGVENVRYVSENYFKMGWTNASTERGHPAKPGWKPKYKPSVLVTKDELLENLGANKKGYFKSSIKGLAQSKDKNFLVLDVRSGTETQLTDQRGLKIANVQIHWKNFFDEKGLTNKSVLKQLQKKGIKRNQRIAVISHSGVQSAAVTMALLDLGFKGAGNFAGGYEQLLSHF